MRREIIAAALAALMAAPAFAAVNEGDGETRSAQTAVEGDAERERERERGRDMRKPERAGADLESCKRDADGMRGPERSRFMTQCLRERK